MTECRWTVWVRETGVFSIFHTVQSVHVNCMKSFGYRFCCGQFCVLCNTFMVLNLLRILFLFQLLMTNMQDLLLYNDTNTSHVILSVRWKEQMLKTNYIVSFWL